MSYVVSTATVNDLDQVAKLLDDYVRQNLNMSSCPCPIATFKRDYTSGCFRMTVVQYCLRVFMNRPVRVRTQGGVGGEG